MARKTRHDSRGDMLLGTLDIMILKTLQLAPAHGHTIAHVIEKSSDQVLQVEHGSLYPALHRLENQGLIASFWGTSENNRRTQRDEEMAREIESYIAHEIDLNIARGMDPQHARLAAVRQFGDITGIKE